MVSLPDAVKQIMRQKRDECNWAKLSDLARAVLEATQGLRVITLDEQGCRELADSLGRTPSDVWFDDVGVGVDVVPGGSFVRIDLAEDEARVDSSSRRGAIADRVRHAAGQPFCVWTRPFGSRYPSRRPPMSPFCEQLGKSKLGDMQGFATAQKPTPLNQQDALGCAAFGHGRGLGRG